MAKRVIGAEHIEEARSKGRLHFELLPGDIVTSLAEEAAARLEIKLIEGPIERPSVHRTDGATAMRRSLYRRAPRWVAPAPAANRGARRLRKLALIGAGGVGGNIAHLAANQDIAEEIALIDIAPGLASSTCLLYTSPSPRDLSTSRMPSSA